MGTKSGNGAKAVKEKIKLTLFDRLEQWTAKRSRVIFFVLLSLSFLFSLLLFNVRISEGGDDSTYIQAGYKYAGDFLNYHYTFNAPLYPMFLALPIALFGINLIVLKFFSVFFTLLHIVFLYLAFNRRIPNLVLFPVLFIVSVNSHFQYYASQTYNEAFFLFIQSFFFYALFHAADKYELHSQSLSKTYKYWLLAGFAACILSLSKNVAVVVLPIGAFFFLVQKNYKNIFLFISSFFIFRIPYEIFRHFVWEAEGQGNSQLAVLLQKDAYHPEKGTEDLAGLWERFYTNFNIYFSRRVMQILNFKDEKSVEFNWIITSLIILLLLWALFIIFKKKNGYLLFASFYTLAMISVSFVVLQVTWDQPRLILVFLQFMLLMFFYAVYKLFQKKGLVSFQPLYLILIIIFMGFSFFPSIKKSKANIPVLQRNLKGDLYYGYTPDWANYLKMSEWVGKNLPDSAFVVCRKASMSFIYSGGKEFYPMYMVTMTDADSILANLKANKVTHAIIANLRKDVNKADPKSIIDTMQRLLKPVSDKYPNKLKLIHSFGTQQLQIKQPKGAPPPAVPEPAYLLEIVY